jgi:hypothetical protein
MYKDRSTFLKNFSALIEFFNSQSVWQTSFFSIVAVRKFLFAFTLVFLNDYPALSLSILIFLSYSIILFIKLKIPYSSAIYRWRDYATEVGFITLHASSYPLLDTNISFSKMNMIGYVQITAIALIGAVHAISILYEQ